MSMASPNTHKSSTTSEDSALSNATLITTVASSTTWSTNHTEGGGYDYELVDGPDTRYECPICLLCLKDPVLTTCGHRFCASCINQWVIKENGKCPVDSVALSHENIFPDNYTRREIMACVAKCPYSKARPSCPVVLPIADLEKHIDSEHCSANGYPLGSQVATGLLECPYKEFGCAILLREDQFERHQNESMNHHLQLLQAAYRRLKIHHSRPSLDYHDIGRQDSRDCSRWPFDEAMSPDDYQFRRQRSWDSVRYARKHTGSASSYTNSLSVGRLPESEEALCNPQNYGASSQNQKSSGSPPEKGKMNGPPSSSEGGGGGSDPHLQDIFQRLVLLEQKDREKQIKIDKLEAELSSATNLCRAITHEVTDLRARFCHGVNVWRIPKFRKLCSDMRRNPNIPPLNSPGFYTDAFGYKLCLRFNLSTPSSIPGCGATAVPGDIPSLEQDEDTFISLFVHFLRGEFDDTLSWPFNGEIGLSVVHPTIPEDTICEIFPSKPDSIAFAKPTISMNRTGIGYAEFSPIHKIFSNGFVKDDTFVCKIVVRVGRN